MTRTRWMLIGGAVGGAVVAGVMVLTAGGGDPAVTAGPSASASPNASAGPSVSAAPTPSPAPSGYLPVDSLGASEIPWDEVGPGWFLVDWAEHDAVWGEDENGYPTVSPADASVSLLSPDGTWYAAASLAATGSDRTVGWLGDSVAVFRTTEPGFTLSDGDVSLVNLKTGASRRILSSVTTPERIEVTANGTLVAKIGYEESYGFFSYDSGMAEHPVCGGVALSIAPDGARVVCTSDARDPGTSDLTEILVGTLGSGAEAEVVDTFRLDPYSYHLAGWLDADTFLVARAAQPEETKGTTYYTYNIVTRKVADFAPPFPSSTLNYWGLSFDLATQTYAVQTNDGVQLLAADGAPIFNGPCGVVGYSGTVALVECSDSTNSGSRTLTIMFVDLKDGKATTVAAVEPGSDQNVRAIYPYTGSLD